MTMLSLRSLFTRGRALAHQGRFEQDLDEELRFHLEMETAANVERGLSPEEARREALLGFGGVEKVKEECRDEDRLRWIETLAQDLRYGARLLRRSPGFTAAAVLTLALGIGANTAVFSVADAVFLRPLPFAEPERLVAVWLNGPDHSVSQASFVELREASRSLADVAAYSGWGFTLTGSGEPEALQGARVSAGLFRLLGARPALGRGFLPEDGTPGQGQVALLGHGLWHRRFGADPKILGKTITIDGGRYAVVGVMPIGFHFPGRESSDLWLPLTIDATSEDFTAGYLTLIGRLAPGMAPSQATAEVREVARRIRERDPDPEKEEIASAVVPLQTELAGDLRPALLVLLAAVGSVLLIACVNVANLLLARASVRQQEIAVRLALGAGRRRLLRQLLTESVMLAVLGGVAGVLLARAGVGPLAESVTAGSPQLNEVAVDGRILLFALGLSLAAALTFGLVPALRSSAPDLQSTLKEGGRSGSANPARQRLRSALVVAEIALALILVAGAGLLIQSLWRLYNVDPGFRTEDILSFRLSPSFEGEDTAPRQAFYEGVLERLAGLPGVEAVGAVHLTPLGGNNWNPSLRVEGRPGEALPSVDWRVATPGYFETLGIPLLAGRSFTGSDRDGAPGAALVNQTFARRVFPGGSPLGQRVNTFFEGKDNWVTIVGVIGDVKHHGLATAPEPEIYRPYAQHPITGMTVMLRASSDPLALAAEVREAVWGLDADVPISEVATLEEVVARSMARPRSVTVLLAVFAGIALLLGAIGIYGVMAYSVAHRRHEIGIRLALGARQGQVLRLVLGQGLALAALGLAVGLPLTAAATRLLESLLFGVAPADPLTLGGVALLLAVVALLASYYPARRAMEVDPVQALRYE
jgi:putative ABC transport system permease protein